MTSWYDPLRALQSKGSTADRPGSLANLAQARAEHQGQFFTPDPVAALMWSIVEPALRPLKRTASILDNSAGSGRLLQFANPEHHRVFGVDVDAELMQTLGQAAEAAGFPTVDFQACGMELIHPRNFDIALINPAFSLHLEAPTLAPYPCTCYGRFGPGTSTLSHAYALAQAVDAAQIVVALLPATFAAEVAKAPSSFLFPHDAARLAAHVELPSRLFREENTDVSVSLLVFGPFKCNGTQTIRLATVNDPLPQLGLQLSQYEGKPSLGRCDVADEGPSITLPVTGDNRVRVSHDGRRIGLKFACGLTQARVANALLRDPVTRTDGEEFHRYPRGVRYAGQGALDMEIHLMQANPLASFQIHVVDVIAGAGGAPVVDPGVRGYIARRARETARQAEPLRHTAFIKTGTADAGAANLVGVAKRDQVANPKVWGSPVIKAGAPVNFARGADGSYGFTIKEKEYRISPDALRENFTVAEGAQQSGWRVVHEGLRAKFPKLAHALRQRAIALGIDQWLTWQFQLDDLIELAMKPTGAIPAWEMGLGKARLAAALALLIGSKHALITVEAGLLDEMEMELRGLPIARDVWQVIRTPEQLRALHRINVISYERLRLPLDSRTKPEDDDAPAAPRKGVLRACKTYAGQLRRRVGVVISDEGDLLANPESRQSRCLAHVSGKRRYVLSGTPIANQCRDILPILAYACGNGTAAQPYSFRGLFLEPLLIQSMNFCARGIDARRAFGSGPTKPTSRATRTCPPISPRSATGTRRRASNSQFVRTKKKRGRFPKNRKANPRMLRAPSELHPGVSTARWTINRIGATKPASRSPQSIGHEHRARALGGT